MKQKNFETFLYSTAGVVGMIIALLAFYVISSSVKQRIDLTAEKAYTLSPGTKEILKKLDSRVTIRFFCTQGEEMPVQLKTYAREVEDLLSEYKQASNGKIVVEKYDPAPDSDAEEAAHVNGIEGQPTSAFGGDRVYLGLAVSILNEKVTIPWLSPDREKMLEYDISRAISRVQNPEPPVIGVMSALPVFGERPNPMMMQQGQRGAEAWVFISELQKDFTVESVPMTVTKIDDKIKVLLVVHPREIPAGAQYAIDQFVLRGGRLLAMVDPHAYFDQKQDQMRQMMGPQAGQSNLDKLFKAWGVDMDPSKIVADLNFGIRNRGNVMPTLLALDRKGINEDDAVSGQIDNVVLPFAGAIVGKPVEGITQTVLLRASPKSQLVEGFMASMGGEQIVKDFKASNTNYSLAVRLAGKFKTAFPDGNPTDKKGETNAAPKEVSLKESSTNSVVVLIADSDMLADQVCVEVQNVLGYKIVRTPNGNLNFVQSVVEQLAGDSNLISLRSRASMNRPFTRVRNMEAAAQEKYQAKIKELETNLAETQRKLQELQSSKQDPQQRYILSPEQQKAVEQYQQMEVQARKDLKQLRKDLRKDTDTLAFWTKVVNIAAMPILVAITGIVIAIVKRKKTAAK